MKNKYYVYCVKLEDEIVYVGKGKGDRYKHCLSGVSHNKGLNEIYFKHQLGLCVKPTINIVEYFDNSDKAYYAEAILIEELQPECNIRGRVEIRKRKRPLELCQNISVVEDLLHALRKNEILLSETIEDYEIIIDNLKNDIKLLIDEKESLVNTYTKEYKHLINENTLMSSHVEALLADNLKGLTPKETFIKLYEEGWLQKDIAEKLGKTERTIRNWVKDYKNWKVVEYKEYKTNAK